MTEISSFALYKCFLNFFFFLGWGGFTISLLFTHCTLVYIQALSLSACNNVNLFITAMEQGKHLLSFFVMLEKS